ncbi:MAG TPA: hypothetical protein DET40_00740 [Lentisphaeria bacterium]|nr:MAG: hypothetical protein A2X45_16815 [Lentisphaerae bacterium GWF2_50_93]HCE42059.1 hypothetical protein [Lentisphaeria bacterium]
MKHETRKYCQPVHRSLGEGRLPIANCRYENKDGNPPIRPANLAVKKRIADFLNMRKIGNRQSAINLHLSSCWS